MPLEGGIYQWAKFGFNEFAGFIVAWNLWLLSITVIALGGMFVTTNISYAIGEPRLDAGQQMVRLARSAPRSLSAWAGLAFAGLSLGKWVHNVGGVRHVPGLWRAHCSCRLLGLARGELKQYHPLAARRCRRCRSFIASTFSANSPSAR